MHNAPRSNFYSLAQAEFLTGYSQKCSFCRRSIALPFYSTMKKAKFLRGKAKEKYCKKKQANFDFDKNKSNPITYLYFIIFAGPNSYDTGYRSQ